MTEFDDRLRSRLLRLEERLPTNSRDASESYPRNRRRTRLMGVASGLVAIALVSGAATAAVLDAVRGRPGVFSAGGALACTAVVEMSPYDADRLLRDLGYSITWQVEDRNTGISHSSNVPPAEGFIQGGVVTGRELIVVVETGVGVEPQQRGC